MNINLADLGLDKERIEELVVDQLVENVMRGYDDMNDTFSRRMQKIIGAQIDASIDRHAKGLIDNTIALQMDNMVFLDTNRYGEKKGEPLSLREYIDKRITEYMNQDVDAELRTQSERSYDWKPIGKRIMVMFSAEMKRQIQQSINAIWVAGNAPLIDAINETVKKQLDFLKESYKLAWAPKAEGK